MQTTRRKKILAVCGLIILFIGLETFAGANPEWPAKAKNLKVLPKDTSPEVLKQTMMGFSKSLGVHCTECHSPAANSTAEKPELDFASDSKPEKNIARDMMRMVNSINHKYLKKAGDGKFEEINCVTCHMGKLKPNVSVDSLPKKDKS